MPVAPAVELRHVSKRFHGAQALSDVDLVIQPGEVHGLLGENGSGKSTLIKVLAGYHEPEPGASLVVAGRRLHLPLPPGTFRSVGMSFVHQDLGLVGELSVLENLWLGRLVTTHRWRLPWRQLRHEALDVFARYGLGLDPDSKVVELNSTDSARLAIVRAVEELHRDRAQDDGTTAGLLVLDEPTVFLPADGVVQLFTLIRDIVATRASVLLVSHDLGEAREITDRLTVLRNGRVAGVVNTAASTEDDLVELIVGRRLGPPTGTVAATASPSPTPASGVQVRALRGGLLDTTSFECGSGEVLGLTGLVGSGFADAIYLIFGALPAAEGTLVVDGVRHDLRRMTPQRATAAGIALLPANRQRDASVADLTVAANVMAPVLDEFAPRRLLRVRELARRCRRLLQRFDVRPPRPELTFDALSGGNQQKALVAKWLQSRPKLLLLHEPTQGVDVGARRQITAIMREAAESGTSIICSSTDAEQLAALCDRVLVFTRGRISAEVAGDRLDSEHISELVFNSPGRPRAAPRGAGV